MDPTRYQATLIKTCRDLWGRSNVYVYGPTVADPNVRVRCVAPQGTNRMTYSPDGDILESSRDATLFTLAPTPPKPRNAIDN